MAPITDLFFSFPLETDGVGGRNNWREGKAGRYFNDSKRETIERCRYRLESSARLQRREPRIERQKRRVSERLRRVVVSCASCGTCTTPDPEYFVPVSLFLSLVIIITAIKLGTRFIEIWLSLFPTNRERRKDRRSYLWSYKSDWRRERRQVDEAALTIPSTN